MTLEEQRLFTLRFGALALANFLVTMTFLLLLSFVAGYAVERFGANDSLAGFAAGSFVLGGLLARLAFGQEIDRWGRRRTLAWSLAIMLAASLVSLAVGDIWLFIAVRVVQGAAFGLATNVTNVAAMDLIPPLRRGEGTGWFTLSTTISHALGPFLGIFVQRSLGDEAVLLVAVGCCAAALVVALLTRVPELIWESGERPDRTPWHLGAVIEPKALPLSLLVLVAASGYASILSFLSAYSTEEGFAEAAPIFFLVYAGFLVVMRPLAGRALDRFGDNAVAIPSLIAYVAGLLLVSQAHEAWQLLCAAPLLALGYGTLVSVFQALAVGRSPAHRTSTAISTFYSGLDAGVGAGPFLYGTIAAFTGHRGMYLAAAVVAACLLAAYWLAHGRRPLQPLTTVGGARG
ncbi:putative MFS-type transporter YfcJ [Pseudoclavibacter triregionum]|nr:putative MFS-type transporter YfcJ [Pseudoclavibacter triregionum]